MALQALDEVNLTWLKLTNQSTQQSTNQGCSFMPAATSVDNTLTVLHCMNFYIRASTETCWNSLIQEFYIFFWVKKSANDFNDHINDLSSPFNQLRCDLIGIFYDLEGLSSNCRIILAYSCNLPKKSQSQIRQNRVIPSDSGNHPT